MKRFISIDIDGILSDYPACWIAYVNLELRTKYSSREEIKFNIGENAYNELKSRYRKSEYKENIPVNIRFVELIRKIKENGFKIIIFTSRPINDNNYPELFSLTKRWLDKNNVFYDRITYKSSDHDILVDSSEILFHIEDELHYAELIANKGVTVFLLRNKWIEKIALKNNNIILFNHADDVERYLFDNT